MRALASPTPARRLISLTEAAQHLGVHKATIRRRIADGTLTGHRIGPRLIRVDLNEVDSLLRAIPAGRA